MAYAEHSYCQTGQSILDADVGGLQADFSEGVPLPGPFNSLGLTALPGSQSGDVIRVLWLSSDSDSNKVASEILAPAAGAQPLQTRDLQVTGISGGALGPYGDSFDSGSTPERDAIFRREWPDSFGITYGLRVLNERNQQSVIASGGVLGTSSWATRAENRLIGPQAGLAWFGSQGPWSIRLQGTALAGFNSGRVDQIGNLGENMTAGRHHHPLYLTAFQIAHSESIPRFSPSGEIIAQTSVRLTSTSAFRVGWTGVLMDNVLIAWDRAVFSLPGMGLRDAGNQSIFVHEAYCGFEWLR